ncbi:farnesyl transferase beta subunit [Xylocopa sonorina]|uniref:farnesyl transferase beta subunit n=1 Tax=Xylocopa sonorina TaxID=1818115 RepID=UPI00403A96B9
MWNSVTNEFDEPHVRTYAEILTQKQDDEGYSTASSVKQDCIESDVLEIYKLGNEPILTRQKHIAFLKKSLYHLSEPFQYLDSSRPWLCYWNLHSLQILGERLEYDEYSKIIGFLAKCQSPEGGFGGGPGQHPHLASTYAAINALCTIGTPQAYQVIDRKGLKQFLASLHGEDGSFRLHKDGETDIRGIYCALSVAKLTNVYTPELFKECESWIARCQTWEGGFGGSPGMEAHGGYAFCGLAALVLLGKPHFCCLKSFLRWAVNRQMRLEGGFQGRTGKLVDGCYSFWQGGAFPLIHTILTMQNKVFNSAYWLFNQEALQEYLLICCQHPRGSLLDKPGKIQDVYHTCYALSGLTVAQHSPKPSIIGSTNLNVVKLIHPLYNLEDSCATNALKYFSTLPIPD